MDNNVTYVFRDSKTYAIHQGKVIAASTDSDEVERQVKQAFGDPHGGMGVDGPDAGYSVPHEDTSLACPNCGNLDDGILDTCFQCGGPMHPGAKGRGPGGMGERYPKDQPTDYEMGGEAGPYMAKVVTPNGLKGTVLGKVAGLWGDEVTVRLENGRIVKLPANVELRTTKTASTKSNPIERLERRLAATPEGTRESLAARSNDLQAIKKHASGLIRDGVSYADSLRLDQIVVTAEVENAEVSDALAHLDDVEAITPPSFSMAAAHEAAGISREDASWLDHTLDEMIKEAEATDFTKLMDEGPEVFAAELPDVALADTGVTRQMASHFIAEKTAGIAREVAEPYMDTFLARVEHCRRTELSGRKQITHKEAAAQEDQYRDLPDDAIFL